MLLSNPKFHFIASAKYCPFSYEKYWGYMACRAKLSSNWPEVKIELLIILYLHSCYLAKQLSPASSLFNVATTDSKRAIYVTRWCVFAEKRPHSHWEFFGNRAMIWVLIWSCLLELGREISKKKPDSPKKKTGYRTSVPIGKSTFLSCFPTKLDKIWGTQFHNPIPLNTLKLVCRKVKDSINMAQI